MMKKCLLLLLFMSFAFLLKAQKITILQQGKQTSIRGLSVVSDSIAWVSGSNGYTALTKDGGKTWLWQQVKGFEKADFRGIEAFSDKEAIIMASGTPALIIKTTDGGKNWAIKYHNADTAYFLDAMDFADTNRGFVLGDPINNKFLLLETNDNGESWHPFPTLPEAIPDEAAFAASGTCLRFSGDEIHIVTGGTESRDLTFIPTTKEWISYYLPITHGQSSKGAFSIAAGHNYVIVGGNYSKDKIVDSVACYFVGDIKAGYYLSAKGPSGYQSCVEEINGTTYLSTGTSGSNISNDGGKNWAKIDDGSFNVCRKAKHGNLVLLAGNNGSIAVYMP